MFRNNETPKNKTTVNCTVTGGGSGDLIGYLVAVNHIEQNCPWINLLIWVPDYFLPLAKHLLPEDTIVRDFTSAKKKYNEKNIGLSTAWTGQHTPMRTSPVNYAFHVLCDKSDLTPNEKNYLKLRPEEIDVSIFTLPEKYVTISVAATARVKELPGSVINKIAIHTKEKGYTPVFIGKKSEKEIDLNSVQAATISDEIDFNIGIDLTNKTSLLEAGAVIAGSKAFIGMEGGLAHLAGCTDVPIIAGYSFIDPKIMAPIRNGQVGYNVYAVTPEESLECRFCQSRISLLYDHDFRECYYDDYKCIGQLTFEKFKAEMDKVL